MRPLGAQRRCHANGRNLRGLGRKSRALIVVFWRFGGLAVGRFYFQGWAAARVIDARCLRRLAELPKKALLSFTSNASNPAAVNV
jgi:hypothetical protein